MGTVSCREAGMKATQYEVWPIGHVESPLVDPETAPMQAFEGDSCLTVAALNTTQIGLGTSVTNLYTRNPAITAAAIATVDEASGGRAVLGLGAGGGLDHYGIDRVQPAVALEETLRIVRSLTAGERVSFRGSIMTIAEAELNFPPPEASPYISCGPRSADLRTGGQACRWRDHRRLHTTATGPLGGYPDGTLTGWRRRACDQVRSLADNHPLISGCTL